jgi:hypothetical protein
MGGNAAFLLRSLAAGLGRACSSGPPTRPPAPSLRVLTGDEDVRPLSRQRFTAAWTARHASYGSDRLSSMAEASA